MPVQRDGGIPDTLAEHVVASSEAEPPEDTLEKLYGEHDESDATRALELIGELAGDGETTTGGPDAGDECRHVVEIGDSLEPAACADGALFFAEAAPAESVTVRSRDPVRDATVRFERDADGWSVTPDGAVVSLGMAADVAAADDLVTAGIDLASGGQVNDRAEAVLCRNVTAFVDVGAYETWAADVEAVSVAVPATVFAAMIRDVAAEIGLD